MSKRPAAKAGAPRESATSTLLGTAGVAELLSVHPKHVFRLLRRGLPGHRLGGQWRFDTDEVMAWLRDQGHRPGALASPGAGLPLLAANGDVCVELLLAALEKSCATPFGFVQADATSGRAHLARGHVLAAGAHGTDAQAGSPHSAFVRVHFMRRSVGLAHQRGKKLRSLKELPGLRLASRAASAGVRAHFDAALAADGLATARIHERALLCTSHRDVALAVLSGRADVGLVSVAWAARLGLDCLPLADEDYGLELRPEQLASEACRALLRTLQSRELKRALSRVPGYDASGMGALRP